MNKRVQIPPSRFYILFRRHHFPEETRIVDLFLSLNTCRFSMDNVKVVPNNWVAISHFQSFCARFFFSQIEHVILIFHYFLCPPSLSSLGLFVFFSTNTKIFLSRKMLKLLKEWVSRLTCNISAHVCVRTRG